MRCVSVRMRVVLVALLPALIVCLLAYQKYNRTHSTQTNIEQIRVIASLSQDLLPLLISIQNERDYSYINSFGSSRRHADLLTKIRKQTDGHISSVLARLSRAKFENQAMRKQSQVMLEKLKLINGYRDKTDNGSIDSNVLLEGYTEILQSILDVIGHMSRYSNIESITKLSEAYHFLLEAMNYASIQRALVGGFLLKKHYPENRVYLALVMSAENNLLKQMLNQFANNDREKIDTIFFSKFALGLNFYKLTAPADVIRKSVRDQSGDIPPDYDSDLWLKEIDKRIEAGYRVGEYIYTQLLRETGVEISRAESNTRATIAVLLAALTLLSLFSLFIILSITRPIQHAVDVIKLLSRDFKIDRRLQITGNDNVAVLGRAFNSYLESFEKAIISVKDEENIIEDLRYSLTSNIEKMTLSSKNQCDHAANILVAIEQMSESVTTISNNLHESFESIGKANDSTIINADESEIDKRRMQTLITELKDINIVASKLSDDTKAIEGILDIIQTIAEQTNLLALNAAIESARAGEQGRGFAVVADEVRILAQSTQDSNKKIREQIESLLSDTNNTAEKIELLLQKGNSAVQAVDAGSRAYEMLKQIFAKISSETNQIAAIVEEQSQSMHHIEQQTFAVQRSAESVYKNAQATDGSIGSLQNTAEKLRTQIEKFNSIS